MDFIISGLTISFFGALIWYAGHLIEKRATYFNQNKQMAQAEIIGYDGNGRSVGYDLLVRIPILSESKIHNCVTGKISIRDYPKGKIVSVYYSVRKIIGITVTEVHLCEKPPKDRVVVARGIKKFAKILLAIALLLVLCGIIKIKL